MKRMFLLTALAAVTVGTMAQDDLYFNPKEKKSVDAVMECPEGHRPDGVRPVDPWRGGCGRDVDEYNRRGQLQSYYQKIGTDSLGNDIIQFQPGDGNYPDYIAETDTVYPGSAVYGGDDEYAYSRSLSRWGDWYGPYDIYYASRWGWPYYYGRFYDPWMADYYWSYGWPYYGYYGYGWPYYGYGWGGYYGWYHPWYYGYGWGAPGIHHTHGGITGTMNHGTPTHRNNGSFGNFGGRRPATAGSATNRVSRFGGNTGSQNRTFGGQRRNSNVNNSIQSRTYTPSRSYTPSQSSGSFGGSRGGSFGGGSRGGGFGGGSRGGSFGGRR